MCFYVKEVVRGGFSLSGPVSVLVVDDFKYFLNNFIDYFTLKETVRDFIVFFFYLYVNF